jgi:hypothetical protein
MVRISSSTRISEPAEPAEVGKHRWLRQSLEERQAHIRTLARLGQLIIRRRDDRVVWFVLAHAESCDPPG